MEIPIGSLDPQTVREINNAVSANAPEIAREIAETWSELRACPDCQVVLIVLPGAPLMETIDADAEFASYKSPRTGCYVAAMPRTYGIIAVAELAGSESSVVRDLMRFRHGCGETPIVVATRIGVVLMSAEIGMIPLKARPTCGFN